MLSSCQRLYCNVWAEAPHFGSARALGVWLMKSLRVRSGRWSLGMPASLRWISFKILFLSRIVSSAMVVCKLSVASTVAPWCSKQSVRCTRCGRGAGIVLVSLSRPGKKRLDLSFLSVKSDFRQMFRSRAFTCVAVENLRRRVAVTRSYEYTHWLSACFDNHQYMLSTPLRSQDAS